LVDAGGAAMKLMVPDPACREAVTRL